MANEFQIYRDEDVIAIYAALGNPPNMTAADAAALHAATSQNGLVRSFKIPIAGGTDTGGGLGSWLIPENGILLRCVLKTTHVSTAANTVDVGTAAGATTDSANLISAQNVHSALVTVDNLTATVGQATCLSLTAGQYITASTTPSTGGASAGLAGALYVLYVPA